MMNEEALTGTMCWQNQAWIGHCNWQKTNIHLLKTKLNRPNKILVKLRHCTGKPLCNLSNLPWYNWSLRHFSQSIWTLFYQYWAHVIWMPKLKICIYLWGRIVNYDEGLQELISSFHYEVWKHLECYYFKHLLIMVPSHFLTPPTSALYPHLS